jgi:hypothetical protein
MASVLIRQAPEDLAAAVCDLLADPQRRQLIATNSRRTAEQRQLDRHRRANTPLTSSS